MLLASLHLTVSLSRLLFISMSVATFFRGYINDDTIVSGSCLALCSKVIHRDNLCKLNADIDEMKEEKALNYGKTDVTIETMNETTSVCGKSLISRMNHID